MRRFTQAAAIVGLAAIVSGAFITSTNVALPQGQPQAGVGVHRAIALAAIAAVLFATFFATFRGAQRLAVWIAWGALIASAAIGWNYPLSPGAAVLHAALAQIFVAAITVALVAASWNKPAAPLEAGAHRGLRQAALITPAAAFAQIVFGALYRHQITGIMPHMLGAMIVALLTMIVSAIVLQHFSQSRELKRAAILLISAVLVQVLLGISTFIMLLLNLSATPVFVWTATAHVTVGTLVFAASVLMAMEAWRNLAPAHVAQPVSA